MLREKHGPQPEMVGQAWEGAEVNSFDVGDLEAGNTDRPSGHRACFSFSQLINASARLAVDSDIACARSELRTSTATIVIACIHAAKGAKARV